MHTECGLCARLCKGGQHAGLGLLKVLLSSSLSFFNYFSGVFPPLKAEAPYTPWIWAPSKARGFKEPLGQGSKTMNKTETPTLWGTHHANKGEGAVLMPERETVLSAGGSGKSSQRGHQTPALKDRGDGRDMGRDGDREVPRDTKES